MCTHAWGRHQAVAALGGLLVLLAVEGEAQLPQAPLAVQPRIMVIPRVKEGQDLRRVLDADLMLRIATTKVKEAFDRRGFSTVDFVGRLRAADEIGLFTSQSQTDVREQIIQMSGADIYVEVEHSTSSQQQANAAIVIMTAYETSTGTSVANKIGNSGRFYGATDDQLIQRAVESSVEELLNTMQDKFGAMLAEGRSILLDISIAQGVRVTLDDVPSGEATTLAELLEDWVADNAWRHSYQLQGVTGVRMLFADIRLPLRDPRTERSYGAPQFGAALAAYFRSLGLSVTRDVRGSSLFITITGVLP